MRNRRREEPQDKPDAWNVSCSLCDYLQIGNKVFYELIREGAPIKKGPGGWWSHIELLDEYFKRLINKKPPRR